MVKISRAQALANSITEAQTRFFYMNEAERLEYISKYDMMQPYQKVALRGCRKIMSSKEKQAFRAVSSPKPEVKAEEIEPSK